MRWSFDPAELGRRRELLLAALVVAVGVDAVLAAALAVKALERRPVLVLPTEEVAVPGEVSDAGARSFARQYVASFDTYTPATAAAATEWLKSRIAPSAAAHATEALDRRLAVVREGRMASLVVPLDEGRVERSGGLAVVLKARRTVFIADQLSRESTVSYRVELQEIPATPGNPSGLAVVRQTVEEEHADPR